MNKVKIRMLTVWILSVGDALVLLPRAYDGRRKSVIAKSVDKNEKSPKQKLILVKSGVAVGSSCVIAGAIAHIPPKNLFLYHPTLASVAIPAITLATIIVRNRAAGARRARKKGMQGREVLQRHIQAHFALTAIATLSLSGSFAAIFFNKIRIGKQHFQSLHARIGVTAITLWLAALAVAEYKVWQKDGPPRWTPSSGFIYKPKWIWGSRAHRLLGVTAFAAVLAAVTSGLALTPYGPTLIYQRPALFSIALLTFSIILPFP